MFCIPFPPSGEWTQSGTNEGRFLGGEDAERAQGSVGHLVGPWVAREFVGGGSGGDATRADLVEGRRGSRREKAWR